VKNLDNGQNRRKKTNRNQGGASHESIAGVTTRDQVVPGVHWVALNQDSALVLGKELGKPSQPPKNCHMVQFF
jgi:hypothetical protein